jgi:threonine synthase
VDSIELLAQTEGIFTETAGGVTVGTAQKLYQQGRIAPEETTVLCITGNGLKTTDVFAGRYAAEPAIAPKISQFDQYMQSLEESQIPVEA